MPQARAARWRRRGQAMGKGRWGRGQGRQVPGPWGPQWGSSRPWPRLQRPLPLAWPRSHLAAPWPGPPATWTGLYAFRIKGEDQMRRKRKHTDKTTRCVIRSLSGRGLWLGGQSNHSINQSANQSITQSIHQLNKQSVEIICWYHLLRLSVKTISWDQLLRFVVEINCWDYLLRLSAKILCCDQLLRLDVITCRNHLLRLSVKIIWCDQLLRLSVAISCWDYLLR